MERGRGAALPDCLTPLGRNEIEIIEVRSGAQLEQALAIRCAVFVDEQGVSEALEIDGRDREARHLLALQDGVPVGTLRLRRVEEGRGAKIERVAVLPPARGAKVGRALVEAALVLARAAGAEAATLHAQTTVQEFYARLGFVAFGPEFIKDGIWHVAMRLTLGGRAPDVFERPH
jgi:predicted GNAT family N-acyltransferase